LPLAAQNHQTGVLAKTILCRAAADRKYFLDAGLTRCHIGVNFDETTLIDNQLLNHMQEWTGSSDLSWLTVEVLETALLHRSWPHIQNNLRRLADQGAAISLDDFGTGYASLQHLLSVPCKAIKIDRSFVARLEDDLGAAQIVCSMIEMARSLAISVVIEGVETDQQLRYFRDRWSGLRAQGFGIGKPVDIDSAVFFVRDKLCNPAYA
ncbi:MAG: EAL domain-containing protein, partial [Candidatus Competibacteraceae bacterium]|nr:EAL domain-containing protein [Candidatus Competibacteraceae bacterium]